MLINKNDDFEYAVRKNYLRGDTMFRNGLLIDHQWTIKINGKFDILVNSYRVWTNIIFLIIEIFN